MNIQLSPCRPAGDVEPMTLVRAGGVLKINGVDHDVAALAALQPDPETGMVAYPDPVLHVQGDLIEVRFPIGPNAPEAARYPAPIVDPADGVVPLPDAT